MYESDSRVVVKGGAGECDLDLDLGGGGGGSSSWSESWQSSSGRRNCLSMSVMSRMSIWGCSPPNEKWSSEIGPTKSGRAVAAKASERKRCTERVNS